MNLVGLCSTYLEGELAKLAIRSLEDACCDHIYMFEGPAGDPLEADVPATAPGHLTSFTTYHEGRWRTDARKRQAMLERAKQDFPGPLWGVIVDGDEVLENARYLRDWLQRLDYHEQVDPDAKYVGRPMRLIEPDGSVTWVRGRLLRLDRILEYKISTSVFTTTVDQGDGSKLYTGGGNTPDLFSEWEAPRRAAIEQDRMMVTPPIPGEPFLVHRSILRHPLRSGLRLHEQERRELEAAGMKVN